MPVVRARLNVAVRAVERLGSSVMSSSSGIVHVRDRARLELLRHQLADEPLLIGDAARRVDHPQAEFLDHLIVLRRAPPLEQPEALVHVRAPAQVHARLVELQLDAPRQQPLERDVDRHAEVEGQVRPHREAVQLADPLAIDAARASRANAV